LLQAEAEAEADDCGHVVPLGGICEPVIGVPLCRSAGLQVYRFTSGAVVSREL